MNNKGVTLLELTVVMAIIVLVFSTAMISIRASNRANTSLDTALRMLQADLRYAQRLAITEGERVRVIFNSHHNMYSLIRPSDEELIRRVHLPQGVSFIGQVRVLEYLPRGTINTGTTIRFRNSNYEQSITITPVTGRIQVHNATPIKTTQR